MNGSCIFEGSSGKSCSNPVRAWTAVTPSVVGQFSAICYYTVRNIAAMHTGERPVGLIETDWGGTPVQAWTPQAGLQACGLPLHNCTTEPGGNCMDYPTKLFNHMVYPFVGVSAQHCTLGNHVNVPSSSRGSTPACLYADVRSIPPPSLLSGWAACNALVSRRSQL